MFDDSDKAGADVVLLHGCPQSCMPNPVEGLLEVYEDVVEVLLVLEIFLTDNDRYRTTNVYYNNVAEVTVSACGLLHKSSAVKFNVLQQVE